MVVWMVRAGSDGEQEKRALENGLVAIGWSNLPDLSKVKTKEELKDVYEKVYPERRSASIYNQVGQIWSFLTRIKEGDLIALPLKTQSAIAIGKVKGGYQYRNDLGVDMHHVRGVEWIKTDIPRNSLDQDLLYSLGAFMTVCQIRRNNAEERIKALLKGEKIVKPIYDDAEEAESIDIEQQARDQIMEYIGQKYKGHDLARLVEAVLQAQGYITRRSDPGADGGVDILAGYGPMGFEDPKICVQVKSQDSPVDVTVFRGIQGSTKTFGADQSLLVCWGGFNRVVIEEARRNYFNVRLWDSGDLLEAILKYYDKFSDALQAELPLKRIWGLVLKEE